LLTFNRVSLFFPKEVGTTKDFPFEGQPVFLIFRENNDD